MGGLYVMLYILLTCVYVYISFLIAIPSNYCFQCNFCNLIRGFPRMFRYKVFSFIIFYGINDECQFYNTWPINMVYGFQGI